MQHSEYEKYDGLRQKRSTPKVVPIIRSLFRIILPTQEIAKMRPVVSHLAAQGALQEAFDRRWYFGMMPELGLERHCNLRNVIPAVRTAAGPWLP